MRTNSEIKSFIIDEFVPGGNPDDLSDEMNLIESGVIDSLGVLNLISALENDWGVQVAPEDMDIENFSTVARIAAFIDARTPASTTA